MVLLLHCLGGSIHSQLSLSVRLVGHQDLPYQRKEFASRYLGNSLCFDDDAKRDAKRDQPQSCWHQMGTLMIQSQNSYSSSYQYLYFEARFKDSFYQREYLCQTHYQNRLRKLKCQLLMSSKFNCRTTLVVRVAFHLRFVKFSICSFSL